MRYTRSGLKTPPSSFYICVWAIRNRHEWLFHQWHNHSRLCGSLISLATLGDVETPAAGLETPPLQSVPSNWLIPAWVVAHSYA